MLSYIMGNGKNVRILDYILDLRREFTMQEVCKWAKVSRPTAMKALSIFMKYGMIQKQGRKYITDFGKKSALRALAQFDMRNMYVENNKWANIELKKEKGRIAKGKPPAPMYALDEDKDFYAKMDKTPYVGQWVAVWHKKVIAHNKNLKKTYNKAIKMKAFNALYDFIREPNFTYI